MGYFVGALMSYYIFKIWTKEFLKTSRIEESSLGF